MSLRGKGFRWGHREQPSKFFCFVRNNEVFFIIKNINLYTCVLILSLKNCSVLKKIFDKINKDELVFDLTIVVCFFLFAGILNYYEKTLGELFGVAGIIIIIAIVQFFVSFSLGNIVVKFIKPYDEISGKKNSYFLWLVSGVATPITLFVLWFGGCMHIEDIVQQPEILFIVAAVIIIIGFVSGIMLFKSSFKKAIKVAGWIVFLVAVLAVGFVAAIFTIEEGFENDNYLMYVLPAIIFVLFIFLAHLFFVSLPNKIVRKIEQNTKILKITGVVFAGFTAFSFMLLYILRDEILSRASRTEYQTMNTIFLLTFILFRLLMTLSPPRKKLSFLFAVLIIAFELIISNI